MFVAFVALALAAALGGPPDVRATIDEAARLQRAGDADAALQRYAQARDQARPGSRDRADALLGLAGVESDHGRYGAAATDATTAAAIYTAAGDTVGASASFNQAGLAALFAGQYADADAAFRRALATAGSGGDPDARAEQLGNLANVQFFVGRYADAARLYDEARRIVDAHAGSAWAPRRRRIVLANQATLEQRLGRDQAALAIYRSLGAASTDLQPSEQAQLLVNLGVLYRRLGDPIKALDTYDRARALFASDRHVDGELGVLKNRGIVLALDLERLDEAEATFTEALAAATRVGNQREMAHALLYRGETRLRAGRPAQARDDYRAALATARALATPEEEWKALYGLGRTDPDPVAATRDLEQAVAVIERVRDGIRIPSRRTEFLNDKREVYDALIAASLARGSAVADVFALLERSHSRGWRERLGLPATVSLQAVQGALPPGVLLLDYWSAPQGSAVIAVSSARAEVVRIQATVDAVAAMADRWSVAPDRRTPPAADPALLLPSSAWFADVAAVIVVPDGPLALVPFDVLTVNGQPLVERAAVSYLPTAAVLLRQAPVPDTWVAPWRVMVRAFGDPVVGGSTLDDAAGVRRRLAATAGEVTAIADELGGRAELHVGADDRKAFLVGGGPLPPILHLATHATADGQALEQSRILFSPAASDATAADYLFLREAYDLPLTGVELAVLSACETERGRLVRGEGVQSFSRAFLAAGARSTVTTLWRVEDQPTADFMTVFYHQLQRGVTRAEALRQAKLRFLHSGTALADPHYWAAFVLNGDGLHAVPRAPSRRSLLLAVVVVAAVLAAALEGLRRRGVS